MNLAVRDVRHNLARFSLTTVGIGMLLMIVMGMGGIYRGLIEDAVLLVNRIDADLWIVQHGTRGPFAEISRIPRSLEDRLLVVPGVQSARAFVSHTVQREHGGKPLRMVVNGLSWPQDDGSWLPLVAGRPLEAAHYEMIADKLLGLQLGETLELGKDVYRVVGLTQGMIGQGGDGLAFFTVPDALAIQFDSSAEAIRLERFARKARAVKDDIGKMQPMLMDKAELPSRELPAVPRAMISAVVVKAAPGRDPLEIAELISGWKDVSVHTSDEQKELLLKGTVDRARRQIGLFTALLVLISAIIMALIIYTLTLDKTRDIAMLKLMGARDSVILSLILQQAVLLGGLGYVLAYYFGQWIFPHFPRRVIIMHEDLLRLGMIVIAISVLSSLLGIWKAMKIQPNEVLS
ncbi:MAG: FtsX-like permease family protein [Desulfomonilaceae bacterium]|nr:FtsX-like permease family protein [Desulfomonilaceae bacterium]